jgi:hypothetical protein
MKRTGIRRVHDPKSVVHTGDAKRTIWLQEKDRRKPHNGPDTGARKGRKGVSLRKVKEASERAVREAEANEISVSLNNHCE